MLPREAYTVGWVCALPIELAAAQEMLDEEHQTPQCEAHDTNTYTCDRIGQHNVVVACLPHGQIGTTSAASVATQMRSSFSCIRWGLMVGIGGGVPSTEADVRLGDVIVSNPYKTYGGVVQYDFGKATPDGFVRTGHLNAPPTTLLSATSTVRAKHIRGKGRMADLVAQLGTLPTFARPSTTPDILFSSSYNHVGGTTCCDCDQDFLVPRHERSQAIQVHYGTIASGNQVMRDAAERDRLSTELEGVLCFEMEAAGLINTLPCLVIRGICNYADSHKNEVWEPYAAGTAAAYAKELLSVVQSTSSAHQTVTEETRTSSNSEANLYRIVFWPILRPQQVSFYDPRVDSV